MAQLINNNGFNANNQKITYHGQISVTDEKTPFVEAVVTNLTAKPCFAWKANAGSDTIFFVGVESSCYVIVNFLENDEYAAKTEAITLVADAWQ